MWMEYKYGVFSQNQIANVKYEIRKRVFYLILIADPETNKQYEGVDVEAAFDSLLHWLGGLNEVLLCPTELVTVIGLLEAALIRYKQGELTQVDFRNSVYRKLVLDAGATVLKIKEV